MADVNGLPPVQFDATISGSGTAALTSLACSPTSLSSGGLSTCTATLSQAAGTGGVAITLSSNLPLLTVPLTALVPAGSTNATFTATAGTVTTAQSAVVTAALNGVSKTATLSLLASVSNPTLTSVSCLPT